MATDAPAAADSWNALRAVMVVAHPGHELRIHHWLERARPLVLILTDASGHTGRSRLASTTAVLQRAGAVVGDIYGRMSDRDFYRALLAADTAFFTKLRDEIASVLERARIDYVVGDSVEGANPAHDVCRLLLNSALLQVEKVTSRRLRNLEFPLEGPPDDCPSQDRADAIVVELSEDAYRRKLAAARSVPEIATDVDRLVSTYGPQAFRIECLRPVRYGLEIGHCFEHPCMYERHGEKQVAAGIYREVIRFREHVAPLAEHLRYG
jgi:hypothetical protein